MLYWICVSAHLLAAMIWLGHMFVWSVIIGPAMKRIEPPETAELLRERSLWMGGLGWPALVVLVVTGLVLLDYRGLGIGAILDSSASARPVLIVKLILVLLMMGYQAIWAHRRAPVLIYANIALALMVLAGSLMLTGRWG